MFQSQTKDEDFSAELINLFSWDMYSDRLLIFMVMTQNAMKIVKKTRKYSQIHHSNATSMQFLKFFKVRKAKKVPHETIKYGIRF